MNFSCHHRLASGVLIASFFVGFALVKALSLTDVFSLQTLIDFWFVLCVTPMFFCAVFGKLKSNPRWVGFCIKDINFGRVCSKILIVLIQLIAIVLPSFVLSQYDFPFHYRFIDSVFLYFPLLLLMICLYILAADSLLEHPKDEYYYISKILKRQTTPNKTIIKQFLLKTLLKIFFIPYMYGGFLLY